MKKLLLASALASTLGSVAGAAVTTAGDDGVRWSGTTPGLPNVCEFYDTVDGEMAYYEGEHNYSISHDGTTGYGSIVHNKFMMGGRWIANRQAMIYVRHRGASQLMVEAVNKVVNSSDGTEYDVQVDYNAPLTVGDLAPSDYWAGYQPSGEYPHIQSYSGKAVRIVSGNPTYANYTWHHTVYNALNPDVENQAGETWTPTTSRTISNAEAEDRVIFNLIEDVELNLTDQVVNHGIVIGGVAWMVDANGESKYDPNNYGMTEGNYFTPHKVSCIQ